MKDRGKTISEELENLKADQKEAIRLAKIMSDLCSSGDLVAFTDSSELVEELRSVIYHVDRQLCRKIGYITVLIAEID